MPSPAAQAAYNEIQKKENAKILPENVLAKMRLEASTIVERVSLRTNIFDKEKEDTFPRFEISELVLGHSLGKGQFGIVHEITSFNLDPATSESTTPKTPSEEVQTRRYMSKQCIRDGDSRYAIKVLRKEVKTDDVGYRNGLIDFAMEARFLAVLQNPHIVKMRGLPSGGFFKDTDSSFIILDRLYDTLETRMQVWKKREGRYKSLCGLCSGGKDKYTELMGEKLLVLVDLANAMTYMHENNVMYRDLKPENIGFDVRDEVKIFDFGLAKELTDAPSIKNDDGTYNLTGFTGSILYMAPEVALSKPYNKSADVFSFGILMWMIISLERPYKTLTLNLIKKLVVHKGHRPVCKDSWPIGLTELMKECWSADYKNRSSFEDIADTLVKEWSSLTLSEFDTDAGLDLSMKSMSGMMEKFKNNA